MSIIIALISILHTNINDSTIYFSLQFILEKMQSNYDSMVQILEQFYRISIQKHPNSRRLKKQFQHFLTNHTINTETRSKKNNGLHPQRSLRSPALTFSSRYCSEQQIDNLSINSPEVTTIFQSPSFTETLSFAYLYRLIQQSDSKKLSILGLRIKKLIGAQSQKSEYDTSYNYWKKIAVMGSIKEQRKWESRLHNYFVALDKNFKMLIYTSIIHSNKLLNWDIKDQEIDENLIKKVSDALTMSVRYVRETKNRKSIKNTAYSNQIEISYSFSDKKGIYTFLNQSESNPQRKNIPEKSVYSPKSKNIFNKISQEYSYFTPNDNRFFHKHSQGQNFNRYQQLWEQESKMQDIQQKIRKETKKMIGEYKKNMSLLATMSCLKK